ncbi:hypothetical protein [Piscinibacter gummiphilus]|uniref:Uncharacterized protein n=1 Tax=Piscinibacter gummiphilus TaxID=946333 RepID=A0ABZ0CNF5_9BURK|nr:hypothetical protein [Piscinibacter gummiphilus]WOB06526.1 hypothetical protein RXV79_16510 [Piscinibacter gummiphilus]
MSSSTKDGPSPMLQRARMLAAFGAPGQPLGIAARFIVRISLGQAANE